MSELVYNIFDRL